MESSTQKKKICSNWGKFGECPSKSKCFFEHTDCTNFLKIQKCNDSKCGGYHRKMCANWKKEGKCSKQICNYLHKTCTLECDEKSCPFYHNVNNKNLDDVLDGFKQKCIGCEFEAVLVYLNCGDNLFCEVCAKEMIKKGKCQQCSALINDYIC